MAVKTWMLAGVSVDDHIFSAGDSCWKRADLVNVPDMIRYSHVFLDESQMHVYENNIGVVVALIFYGNFPSFEAMQADYYSSAPASRYTEVYNKALTAVNRLYHTDLPDFDWVIPVVEGDLQVLENYCSIPEVGTESKAFVSLIDCSIIYTSIRRISDFVHFICNKKKLTKYQRWQLAYYQISVRTVESPKIFLTNKEEIAICTDLYRCWQIDDNVNAVISNIDQAITLFSFLSGYEESEDSDLFSSFLTFFGIIVGLEAIYNLCAALFVNIHQWMKTTFVVIIAVVVLSFGAIFMRKAIKKYLERREFKRKTGKRRG